MPIQEFYRKFSSTTEQCDLFAALRNLGRIEDAKALMTDGTGPFNVDWPQWPDTEAQ